MKTKEAEINISDKKVFWLANSMGYGNNLLYWEPLLSEFVRAYPLAQIHTCETQAEIGESGYEVKASIVKINFNLGFRKYSTPSPLSLYKLLKAKPDLIIVSEFGLISLYSAIYRLLNKQARLLLLVENDPAFLESFYQKKRKTKLFSAIRSFIANRADRVLCNNKRTESYLTNNLGTHKDKIITACYLTSALPAAEHTKEPSDRLSLLFAGRLVPGKGVHLLLEALKLLPPEAKNNVELNIIGDGPEREHLEQRALELKLTNVNFYGQQPYENLNTFFASADVFIFPTLGDYRALVGFEALSAGLPIIGSVYDGASEEVIIEGINGFAIDPRDIKQLAEKIQFFINDRDELKSHSENSIKLSAKFLPSLAAANIICATELCIKNETRKCC